MTTLEIIDNKIEKTEELLARAVEVSDYDQRNFYEGMIEALVFCKDIVLLRGQR